MTSASHGSIASCVICQEDVYRIKRPQVEMRLTRNAIASERHCRRYRLEVVGVEQLNVQVGTPSSGANSSNMLEFRRFVARLADCNASGIARRSVSERLRIH